MATWEDAPTSNGWEDAPEEKKDTIIPLRSLLPASTPASIHMLMPQDIHIDNEPLVDKGRGVVEAGISMATSLPMIPIAAAGGLLGNGEETAKEILSHTYQPRTEKGQEYSQELGELINRYWPGLMHLHGPTGMARNAELRDTLNKASIDSQVKLNWENAPNVSIVKGLDDAAAVEQAAKAKQEPQAQPDIANDVARLHDQAIQDRLQEIDREQSLKENFQDIKNEDAQKAIEDRQTQLEQDVIKQGTLDYNVAERARQEEARLPDEQQQVGKDDAYIQQLLEDADRKYGENQGDKGNVSGTPMFFRENMPLKNMRGQGGMIDPAVFKEGFEKLKQLADGTWLRAFSHDGSMTIEAVKDSRKLGGAVFEPSRDGNNVSATMTGINRESRGKGLATEVYKFASELGQGNDVVPSQSLTQAGRAMWEGFERKGVSKGRVIPGSRKAQEGAVILGPDWLSPKNKGKAKFLAEHPATKLKTIVPEKLTPEQAIGVARESQDVPSGWFRSAINQLTKGGQYQALKTDHPIIKYAYEQMINMDREARGLIQQYVHDGLAKVSRSLSDRDAAQVVKAINRADFNKVELTEDILRQNGANDKQIAYWKTHQATMDRVFEGINNVLTSLGKEPIEKRTAYAAMRATGDFRRLVYKLDDKGEKHIVGIIGSDFRKELDARKASLEALHPEYTVGEEKYFGGVPRDKGNAAAAMDHTLEILSKNDPRIKEFLDTYDKLVTNEVYNFLNMKRHTMQKKGIFGMEGRKDWLSDEQNAKEFMQAQINYAEAGLKWEAMSKGANNVYKVLKDNAVSDRNPNAVAWADYYVKNALGFNPDKVGHFLEQAFAAGMEKSGVGYSKLREGFSIARKVVNTTLLGWNPPFWLTNIIQPFMSMPGTKAYLASKGLNLSWDAGTGYNYFAKAALTEWKHYAKESNELEAGAYKYAEKNHVYGSDLIEHSNRARKDALYMLDKYGGVASNSIESGTRRLMYLSFVHMLDENGLSVKNGLYETAHNLTDMSMNNYSTVERPRIYNMGGPLGQTAANLSSYKHNEVSRLALFARQIKENEGLFNKTKPVTMQLASTIAYAGILGLVAWEEADWAVKEISKLIGKPYSLTQAAIDLSEKTTGGPILSHGMFSTLGVDMSKRLGIQNLVGTDAMDVGFPGASRLVDSATSLAKGISSPSEMNAKRYAYNLPFMPQPARTNMELEWFSKNNGKLGNNVNTLKAAPEERTQGDINAKRLGFTGIHESVSKDKKYQADWVKKAYGDLRQAQLEKARDEIYSKGNISQTTVEKYLKYQGDPNTLVTDLMRYEKEQNVPAVERDLLRDGMSHSITSLMNAQRLSNAYKR